MQKWQYGQMPTIDEFIDSLLTEDIIDIATLYRNLGDQEDMLLCFAGFLVSKCLLRQAPNYRDYGIFVFSKPGRSILKNSARRRAFVEEFTNFYKF